MSWRNCLACRNAEQKPKRGKGVRLVFDPRMTMPGPPTLEGHRLGAEFIGEYVWAQGFDDTVNVYELTREQVIVCCWWTGIYSPRRKWKARWREWAESAGHHLWHGCINVSDPPVQAAVPV